MPQALNDEWRQELGADCQTVHERWLHRLANLTLTAYNSEYSNCSFTRKRDMEHGFRDSGLRLNGYLARLEHWDEAALQERQRRLLDDALTIWPRPVSSYCPPRPPEERMNLADWDAAGCPCIVGKIQLRCILLGQELQAATWRNVLLVVVRALYARDAAVLVDLIRSTHPYSEKLFKYFSGMPQDEDGRSYDKVDEGVYLYSHLTPWSVARLLRLLLPRYNIDLSDLTIFFKPRQQTPAETGEAPPQLQ